MSDYIVRATALEGNIRAFGTITTHLVEELRHRHQSSPVATAAVGRAATVGAIMGVMLKGEDRLTIRIKGGGPIGQIVVDANANGEVRAYATNPHVDLPLNSIGKLDVAGAVGTDGFLHVTKDLGLREPYSGSVELISGELGEDFAYYFTQSEQTPSVVGVGVLVDRDYSVKVAGGFILQVLPGVKDEDITYIEEKLSQIPGVTTLLTEGTTPEDILTRLIPGDVKIHERIPVKFRCTCNRERLEELLVSLGKDELQNMLHQDRGAEVVCSFCKNKYYFTEQDLETLIDRMEKKE
ncbi:Hsp33 family molecular chaperone HslO [Effusibacillus lacus]|uniref:33 kDa chaperonin n=1 Tax=Effusibacillus lacus TaxID=1348429 RepID=A0A292YJI3_9BACL|nr:Hsp33 family molecular chaperone HslO [Effusibacillus lacus]TCS74490.1 molecular chaperone Hsp33 [Effusibacillus lacus]GAX88640.1 molecular chaperone Hsp33 [Effusibacillus lacus]